MHTRLQLDQLTAIAPQQQRSRGWGPIYYLRIKDPKNKVVEVKKIAIQIK
jgi:hypothetical protein